jgi:glutamine synthetase
LPKTLGEALTALRADEAFRAGFGPGFIDYYAHIKDAELARFAKDEPAQDQTNVTAWEQNEYLDLF